MRRYFLMTGSALSYLLAVCPLLGRTTRADNAPEVPRIDSVVMSALQPQASDEAVIWNDDPCKLRGVSYFSYLELLNARWPNEDGRHVDNLIARYGVQV